MIKSALKNIVDNILINQSLIYRELIKPSISNPFVAPGLQIQILVTLSMNEDKMSITEIGKRLAISKPNMTTLIDKLSGDGLVKREYNKIDRRKIKILLTKKGRQLIERTRDIYTESISKRLSNLQNNDLDELASALEKVKIILLKTYIQ